MTGRASVLKFHSGSRSARCLLLNKALDIDKPSFEISGETAKKYGTSDQDQVKIISSVGSYTAFAQVKETLAKDCVFLPFTYKGASAIVKAELDPISKQPSLKSGAVRLEKISG